MLEGGERLEIIANHIIKNRMPRAHEYARQMMTGHPISTVEDREYSWAVLLNRRRVGTLRQMPSGNFSTGPHIFPHMTIEEAAEELVYRLGIRPRPEDDEAPGPKP